MTGRKKPYTVGEIHELKCIRCGKQANQQWQVCADGNTYRPLCIQCDVELNDMVLKWASIPNAKAKMKKYRVKMGV